MKEDRKESNEQESDSSFTSREHQNCEENIITVKRTNIKEEQWRASENITPTTVRIFKLSPVETKSQNKNLYINKKLNITKIRKKK